MLHVYYSLPLISIDKKVIDKEMGLATRYGDKHRDKQGRTHTDETYNKSPETQKRRACEVLLVQHPENKGGTVHLDQTGSVK